MCWIEEEVKVGMGMMNVNVTGAESGNPYMIQNQNSIINSIGTVIKGTISGLGEQAKVTIGDREVGISKELIQGKKLGDEMQFVVESADGKSVVLKAMQEYVGAQPEEGISGTLENMSQLKIQRNTDQFVNILSESELSVDVTADIKKDSETLSRLSADDLRMLRQLGIDVANSDLSHLIGLVNQYHAQQEGRTFQTGSPEVTEAIAKAQSIGRISDGAKKYMMENQMSFTYENAYKAEYSAMEPQPASVLSEEEWEQLRPQVDKMLENQNMPVTVENEQAARWLIEQNCDISRQNLILYQQIEEFNQNGLNTSEYADNVVAQLNVGEKVEDAALIGITDAKAAQEIVEGLSKTSNAAVDWVVSKHQEVNLNRLFTAQQMLDIYLVQKQQPENGDTNITSYSNMEQNSNSFGERDENQYLYQQLQEIRLRLTLQAGYTILHKGVSLTTESLKDIIEELNQLEAEKTMDLFRDSRVAYTKENYSVYQETMLVTSTIPTLPAASLGIEISAQEVLTLNGIYRQGMVKANFYYQSASANEESVRYETISGAVASYETMMTRPRSDMGDSIYEAFSRMDSLLEEMGIALTDENRKAARILAYNQMELSEDNIQRVVALDTNLNSILKDMQPEVVLGLIRDGINPLHLSLPELRKQIDLQKEKNGESSEEKYSEFLYQMDSSGTISEDERKSYIGIYRLLNAVTSHSGRDLGAVMKNDQELTLANLLSAHRSRRQQGTDIKIDEEFGFLQNMKIDGSTITEQISAAFSKLQEQTAALGQSDTQGQDLQELELENIRQLSNVEQEGIALLKKLEIPYTPANLLAAQNMISNSSTLYQDIKKELERRKNTELTAFDNLEEKLFAYLEEMDQLQQSLDSVSEQEQGMKSAKELPYLYQDIFYPAFHAADEEVRFTARDLMAVKQIHTMMRVADAMQQKHQNYLIPITVGDEVLTMNVHFQNGENRQQGFIADVDTIKYGRIQAQLQLQEEHREIYFYCESQDGMKVLEENKEVFAETLTTLGIHIGSTQVPEKPFSSVMENYLVADGQDSLNSQENASGVYPNRILYEAAKAFVQLIRSM